jgi:hypothetical protein
MPLEPDKLREANEKAQSLSKRFDSYLERRKADPDDDDEDEAEEATEEAAERATEASLQPEIE